MITNFNTKQILIVDNNLIRGDINELQCILDFQKRGYYCSIPFSKSCRYDLIVDIDNKLFKIQCKASSYHSEDGTLVMSTTRSTTNTKETITYSYSKEEIDYFYTSWKQYGFLIPVEEAQTKKYLRVNIPKQGIQSTMSIASDYLIDNVLESIIQNKPIKRYMDNRIISINEKKEEKLWTTQELLKVYNERQIRYIKEKIMKKGTAFGLKWRYKEFPIL